MAALEKGASFSATQAAVQQVQANCLQQLRDVKVALAQEKGTKTAPSASAVAEQKALAKKVAKLEYRVQHLVQSMEYLYEKSKAVPSS